MINRKSENGNPEKGNDGMIDNIDGNNKALEDAIKNAEQVMKSYILCKAGDRNLYE